MRALALLAGLLLGLLAGPVRAHESLPVSLTVTELASGRFDVAWRIPAVAGPPLPLAPLLPEACQPEAPPRLSPQPGALVGRMAVRCAAPGLAAGRVGVAGLDHTVMDALVRVVFLDGREVSRVLRPQEVSFDLAGARGATAAAGYFRLGVEHILLGIDHLLFVAGLVLLVRGLQRLVATVTAFTLAHSITLAGAALGAVSLPGPPVEAAIALSIVFLARELLRQRDGEEGLAARRPWLVAFAFGLLHGFGFAGALAEVGLPRNAVPQALLLFNLGVEAGQLLFVALLLAVRGAGRAGMWRLPALPGWTARLPAYAIGGLAGFWVVERVAVIL